MLLIKSFWMKLMLMMLMAILTMMTMKMLSLKTKVRREPLSENEARVSSIGQGLIRMQHCLAVELGSGWATCD